MLKQWDNTLPGEWAMEVGMGKIVKSQGAKRSQSPDGTPEVKLSYGFDNKKK